MFLYSYSKWQTQHQPVKVVEDLDEVGVVEGVGVVVEVVGVAEEEVPKQKTKRYVGSYNAVQELNSLLLLL